MGQTQGGRPRGQTQGADPGGQTQGADPGGRPRDVVYLSIEIAVNKLINNVPRACSRACSFEYETVKIGKYPFSTPK